MSSKQNAEIQFSEENPEVKSYILQQIADLESYLTESTVVSVVSKDPKKLALQLETDGNPIPLDELKKMFRIAIVLREDDTEVQAEGLDLDIFSAIRQAKNRLEAHLADIQDQVLSSSERQNQINEILKNHQIH